MRSTNMIAAGALALITAAAMGGTTTVTFSGGANDGGWTWGCCETILGSGGNPGSYLRATNIDTFAPQPRTTTGGAFVGDFRAMGVTSVGVDLITFDADFSVGGRPCTLMLVHDNGTPANQLDDTAAYFEHANNIPLIGAGWQSYDFDVQADDTTLPAGWVLLNLGDSGAPATHTWDEVIQDVDRVRFFYGNPEFVFIFQQWTLGMDNVRITGGPIDSCPGDVNADGMTDVDDIVQIILAWGTCIGCPEDIVGTNNRVDIDDVIAAILDFGTCGP